MLLGLGLDLKIGMVWDRLRLTQLPLFVILLIFFTKIMSNHKCYVTQSEYYFYFTLDFLLQMPWGFLLVEIHNITSTFTFDITNLLYFLNKWQLKW